MSPLAGIRARNPGRSIPGILFYECIWSVAWAISTIFYRLRVRGGENIPASGAVLVIANHQSNFDPPCVSMAFKSRQLNFIARSGLFKSRLFGLFIHGLNAVPIKESGSDTAAIRTALEQLAKGRALLIFPEGTRSSDGEIHEFKRGFWLLMSRAKCPVLPIAIEGAFDAFPRGTTFPHLWGRRIALGIGKPLSHELLLKMGPERGLPFLREVIEAQRQDLRHELALAKRALAPDPA